MCLTLSPITVHTGQQKGGMGDTSGARGNGWPHPAAAYDSCPNQAVPANSAVATHSGGTWPTALTCHKEASLAIAAVAATTINAMTNGNTSSLTDMCPDTPPTKAIIMGTQPLQPEAPNFYKMGKRDSRQGND